MIINSYAIRCQTIQIYRLFIQQSYPSINYNQKMRSFKSFSHNHPQHTNSMRLQNMLKKEIDNKFNKKTRKDDIDYSTQSINCKTSSFFLNNPLTKSSFSLNDAITHKGLMKDTLQPIKKAVKSMSSKKFIALSSRQRYSTFNDTIFKTRAQVMYTKDVKEEAPLRKTVPSLPKKHSSQGLKFNQTNKFRLLFKEPKLQYKSASQRKMARIDTKINTLRQKRLLLQSLLPAQKAKQTISKIQTKNYNLSDEQFRDKVLKMVNQLIKTIQLYFNMYQHANIVGSHFRNVQGYNKKIKNFLMLDEMRARRIQKSQEITSQFQVFQIKKMPTYMEEDMALFNLLNNFLLKLQKRYAETLQNYNYYQNKKRKDEKQAFTKTHQKFQKKLGRHQSINKINDFIQNRLRFDQGQRQQYMSNLQKRGVTLNLIQRSRQLILRQKENAVKNSLKINSIK